VPSLAPRAGWTLRAIDVGGFLAVNAGMVWVSLVSNDPQDAPAMMRVAGVFLIMSRASTCSKR
jgi:hypothetical protein